MGKTILIGTCGMTFRAVKISSPNSCMYSWYLYGRVIYSLAVGQPLQEMQKEIGQQSKLLKCLESISCTLKLFSYRTVTYSNLSHPLPHPVNLPIILSSISPMTCFSLCKLLEEIIKWNISATDEIFASLQNLYFEILNPQVVLRSFGGDKVMRVESSQMRFVVYKKMTQESPFTNFTMCRHSKWHHLNQK